MGDMTTTPPADASFAACRRARAGPDPAGPFPDTPSSRASGPARRPAPAGGPRVPGCRPAAPRRRRRALCPGGGIGSGGPGGRSPGGVSADGRAAPGQCARAQRPGGPAGRPGRAGGRAGPVPPGHRAAAVRPAPALQPRRGRWPTRGSSRRAAAQYREALRLEPDFAEAAQALRALGPASPGWQDMEKKGGVIKKGGGTPPLRVPVSGWGGCTPPSPWLVRAESARAVAAFSRRPHPPPPRRRRAPAPGHRPVCRRPDRAGTARVESGSDTGGPCRHGPGASAAGAVSVGPIGGGNG